MRYWDASAVLPLLTQEEETNRRQTHLREDPQMLTWWGTRVECVSALSRLLRQRKLDEEAYEQLLRDLQVLSSGWTEIQPTEKVRQRALRLLRLHALRAGDALQLAAALVGSEESPQTLPFVCGDPRLAGAARKEGFPLLP